MCVCIRGKLGVGERMYSSPAVLNCCLCFWVYTYGSVDVNVCGCIRILPPGAAWERTWLMTCVLWWKSFTLKQNGIENVWLHETCSARYEVNEMWQTLLFWFGLCNLFHNKVFGGPCQCCVLQSLLVSRHWMIHCNWSYCGAIKREWSCFICMHCFTETSVVCQNCLHWRNTPLQDSLTVCAGDTVVNNIVVLSAEVIALQLFDRYTNASVVCG